MNILITGGTGLIGSKLIPFLTNHHKLIILTRNKYKVFNQFQSQADPITDLSEIDFNDIDIIINLAGEAIADKRWSKKQKTKIQQSRWQLTQQLVNEINAASSPPHTFISGSAIGYYGKQANQVINESFEQCHDEFSHQLCKKWEHIAYKAQSAKTRVCVLRTGIVLCNNGGALKKMLPAFKCCLGGPIASGEQYMSWIHIDDILGIILHLIENPKLKGTFNATAPEPVTNQVFSQLLAKQLHRPSFVRVPETVLRILLGEMAELLVYGQNVQPIALKELGFRFHYPKLDEALAQLLRHDTQ